MISLKNGGTNAPSVPPFHCPWSTKTFRADTQIQGQGKSSSGAKVQIVPSIFGDLYQSIEYEKKNNE